MWMPSGGGPAWSLPTASTDRGEMPRPTSLRGDSKARPLASDCYPDAATIHGLSAQRNKLHLDSSALPGMAAPKMLSIRASAASRGASMVWFHTSALLAAPCRNPLSIFFPASFNSADSRHASRADCRKDIALMVCILTGWISCSNPGGSASRPGAASSRWPFGRCRANCWPRPLWPQGFGRCQADVRTDVCRGFGPHLAGATRRDARTHPRTGPNIDETYPTAFLRASHARARATCRRSTAMLSSGRAPRAPPGARDAMAIGMVGFCVCLGFRLSSHKLSRNQRFPERRLCGRGRSDGARMVPGRSDGPTARPTARPTAPTSDTPTPRRPDRGGPDSGAKFGLHAGVAYRSLPSLTPRQAQLIPQSAPQHEVGANRHHRRHHLRKQRGLRSRPGGLRDWIVGRLPIVAQGLQPSCVDGVLCAVAGLWVALRTSPGAVPGLPKFLGLPPPTTYPRARRNKGVGGQTAWSAEN